MENEVVRHTVLEDVVAVITGTFFVALGIMFLQISGLATGGVAGLSLIAEHVTGLRFSVLFLVLNLPFYIFAWVRLGRVFALSSFVAASSVSFFNELLSAGLDFKVVSPFLSAIIAGMLMGVGMLMLFRHRASLGGFNVLAVYLQEKKIISAGKAQLLLDGFVLLALGVLAGVEQLLPSILSVVVLNLVLIMNHKGDRYRVRY